MDKLKGHIYTTSSAAYRAIRHFEVKNGKTSLTVKKEDVKDYRIIQTTDNVDVDLEKAFREFEDKLNAEKSSPNVHLRNGQYRFFPDGVEGPGFYEIKTGNRRRPNSDYVPVKSAFETLTEKIG